MRRIFSASAAVLVACLLSACTGSSAPEPAASSSAAASTVSGSLTVAAAASLTDVFEQIGEEFRAQYPDVDVAFTFGGSKDLVAQITEGAPADVLATADENTMSQASDAGLTEGTPKVFATNTLEIAVAPGNPLGVTSLADLARSDLKIVVCAEQVPCGAATALVAEKAGVALTPVSEESSVTDVLGKVTSGEADAGLVYVTDIARANGGVEGVTFPESSEAVNSYPIATLASSKNAAAAQAFMDFVRGADGQRILEAAGFGAP